MLVNFNINTSTEVSVTYPRRKFKQALFSARISYIFGKSLTVMSIWHRYNVKMVNWEHFGKDFSKKCSQYKHKTEIVNKSAEQKHPKFRKTKTQILEFVRQKYYMK